MFFGKSFCDPVILSNFQVLHYKCCIRHLPSSAWSQKSSHNCLIRCSMSKYDFSLFFEKLCFFDSKKNFFYAWQTSCGVFLYFNIIFGLLIKVVNFGGEALWVGLPFGQDF